MDTSPGYLERSFHFNVTTVRAQQGRGAATSSAGEGAIVNIRQPSAASATALSRTARRGALSHMTRLMARTSRRKCVNGIAVGSIATSALKIVLEDAAIRDEMVRRTPLKRLGEPADIARCALYLASPAASFVTGKLMEIDGGLEEANLEMGLPDL